MPPSSSCSSRAIAAFSRSATVLQVARQRRQFLGAQMHQDREFLVVLLLLLRDGVAAAQIPMQQERGERE